MSLSTAFSNLLEPKQYLKESRRRFSDRDLFRLILPILVEQLLTLLAGITDTLMVSYAGDAAVSGVSLVNQLNNVFIFIFGAVASGGAVVASQYVGRADKRHGVTAARITRYISISRKFLPGTVKCSAASSISPPPTAWRTDCSSYPRWHCPASWPCSAR